MSREFAFIPERTTGDKGNCWNNESTGANGWSKIVDVGHCPHISILGKLSGESTIEFHVSADGVEFNKCNQITGELPGAQVGVTEFHVFHTVGARFMKLKSSNNVTATISIVAKM